jgi:integrase
MASNATETIWPEQLSQTDLKELRKNTNVLLGSTTNQSKKYIPKKTDNKRLSRRLNRKHESLTDDEYKIFIKHLKWIDPKCAVIAQILWHVNIDLKEESDFITCEQILRLTLQDVDLSDETFTCITLMRSASWGDYLMCCELPWEIRKALSQLMRPDRWYVFSNKNGGPLLPHNIDRIFKKASRQAGLRRVVTSLSLRPQLKLAEHNFKDISIEEWQVLCAKIPSLQPKQGRPPKYDPRDSFNGILYQKRTKTSFRNLPSNYPKGISLHSQYRRWKENGVFDAVLAARQ